MNSNDPLATTVLQPQIEHSDDADSQPESTQARIQFAAGKAARFADETAALLRERLILATFVLSLASIIMFVSNWFYGDVPLPSLRIGLLVVLVGCHVLLRSAKQMTLNQLLVVEFIVFGGLLGQLVTLSTVRMLSFAADGDVASVIAVRHVFEMAGCVVMMTYGLFIPNTWRRATAILIPVALVPLLLPVCLSWFQPTIAAALAADHASLPIPVPLIAAFIVIVGSHSINRIRKAAFQARRFGQYILKERIASGGMGEVYRAEHRLLKRPCAVKLIRQDRDADGTALAQFELEVQATARLSHWNTIEIYDYGRTDDGTFYYVMELLPGLSLDELVRRHGPMPPARAVHFLKQVCSALREAHSIGLIHRDIKPANIYAAQRGGVHDVAKLIDFGLVKQISADATTTSEKDGISGSPQYMSPEQASRPTAVDARSDIYAVGGVAFYLLTDRPPFLGNTLLELITAHATKPVTPPRQFRPEVPSDLNDIVVRCLSKSPANRFQTASDLLDALHVCSCANEWTERRAASCWQADLSE